MSLLGMLMSLTLVASTSAVCCIPEKYTTWLRSTSYISGSIYRSEGVQYFDATLKKTATFTKITRDDGSSSTSKVYQDLHSGELFTLVGDTCIKAVAPSINADKPNCFPKNVTVSESLFIGGPHEDLKLQQITIPAKNTLLQMTVTKKHCIPVHISTQTGEIENNKYKTIAATDVDFLNLTPTVHDSSPFVIPDACKNAITTGWYQISLQDEKFPDGPTSKKQR